MGGAGLDPPRLRAGEGAGPGLLLTRSGQTLYSVALGNQTLDSVLPIASSTKTPSAAVILSLVDEGRIDLDVPMAFGWWFSPALHPGSRGPELSDQGAFGCTPWIDFDLGYAATLLIKDRTQTGTEIWDAVRPIIISRLAR